MTTLSSLTEWSQSHIKDVFEATTTEASTEAISRTFSKDLKGTINGMPLPYDSLVKLVTMMREASATGLKVTWKESVEVAQDPSTNRDGVFGGYYIISGLTKQLPGTGELVEHERHKAVNVIIKSQSDDPSVDSRRVDTIVFVGNDRPTIRSSL
ncbi:hypothetical protein BDZ89DRAFT_1060356 [Hymenopellis radicata]|nr:hypothetical protein BDZ89DRAFT_1060356 [Hymenopellis radicata]